MKKIIFAIDVASNFGNHDGSLPWETHHPVDMENFRKVTIGNKNIVCGFNTARTLPKGLPQRDCYMITKGSSFSSYKPIKQKIDYKDIDSQLPDNYTLIGGAATIYQALKSDVTFDEIWVTIFKKINEECDVIFDLAALDEYNSTVHYEDKDLVILLYNK